jgi:hypothetical protein
VSELSLIDFKPWPKIGRLNKAMMTITEKVDGTNAQINIHPDYESGVHTIIRVGSRNRELGWIKVNNLGEYMDCRRDGDNFGFFAWCVEHCSELLKLGNGRHYGEWWGQGIQIGYGQEGRFFSLFNARRWTAAYEAMKAGYATDFPSCCSVVPILKVHAFDPKVIDDVLYSLRETGSIAAPGWMEPEGIIVEAFDSLFKLTYANKDGKWQSAA